MKIIYEHESNSSNTEIQFFSLQFPSAEKDFHYFDVPSIVLNIMLIQLYHGIATLDNIFTTLTWGAGEELFHFFSSFFFFSVPHTFY